MSTSTYYVAGFFADIDGHDPEEFDELFEIIESYEYNGELVFFLNENTDGSVLLGVPLFEVDPYYEESEQLVEKFDLEFLTKEQQRVQRIVNEVIVGYKVSFYVFVDYR